MSRKHFTVGQFYGTEFDQRIAPFIRDAKDRQWPHWFNGFPTTVELLPLLKQLTTAMPHIDLRPARSMTDGAFCRFFACMEGQPYTLGWVGYDDFNTGSSYRKTYGVGSRLVSNEKYSEHKDQYHILMPGTVLAALKSAKRYLLPYTTMELGHIIHEQFEAHVGTYRNHRRHRVVELVGNPIMDSYSDAKKVAVELKNLYGQNVTFVTDIFARTMEAVDEACELVQFLEGTESHGKFVRIERGEVPMIQVIASTGRVGEYPFGKAGTYEAWTYEADQLPDDIVGKVAVLQTLTNKSYVEGVGYKYTNDLMFIEEYRDVKK